MKRIEFKFRFANGSAMKIGWIPWPFDVSQIEADGDIVTVHDSKGEATFSLADIKLSDLSI